MANAGEEDSNVVLSDLEADEDDPVPVKIAISSPSSSSSSSNDVVPMEKYREVVFELDRERQARAAVEKSKDELESSFKRLKFLAHEAIKKRDECNKLKDEALREKEEGSKEIEKLLDELSEAKRLKEDVEKQRDEMAKQLDVAVNAKESVRSEVESGAQMLVSGIEKITGKANHIKNFSVGGLPKSQKYAGLPAIAYGVIKRTNEIVEELLKQLDSVTKSRNEAREQVEQRNFEIAIEVSQLESTIGQLREEVARKSGLVENLEKSMAEKDGNLAEIEGEVTSKLHLAEEEASEQKKLVKEYDDRLKSLEAKVEAQRPLLVKQLRLVSKVHDQLYDVIKIVNSTNSEHSDFSESLFLPQQTGFEENIRASLAGMESIHELSRIVICKTRDVLEEKNREVKSLNEAVARLVREKEHVGVLLRGALSKRLTSDTSAKASDILNVVENGLRDAGIKFDFGNPLKDRAQETKEDEIYALAGALENIITASQIEIIELQRSLEELRAESTLLKEHMEAQVKELSQRKLQIEELEQKETAANDNVEGLMMDIAAAEEEIKRWKLAAEQEAGAGRAVEQEYLTQLSVLNQELEGSKQSMIEWEKKLKFKEETAATALAARDAAEKSLRLADARASRLRDRVEELTRQFQEADVRAGLSTRNRTSPRYVCWPWEWLGLDFVGVNSRNEMTPQQERLNEMELLSEPLI